MVAPIVSPTGLDDVDVIRRTIGAVRASLATANDSAARENVAELQDRVERIEEMVKSILNGSVTDEPFPEEPPVVAATDEDDEDVPFPEAEAEAEAGDAAAEEIDDVDFPDQNPAPEDDEPAEPESVAEQGTVDAVMAEPTIPAEDEEPADATDEDDLSVTLADGTYPIRDIEDLHIVVDQFDEADEAVKPELREHIRRRAAELSAEAAEAVSDLSGS